MKNKQNYHVIASTTLLFFMMLGYLIKFYPATLTGFDSGIQTAIRGNLDDAWTTFYKLITNFGGEVFIFVYTLIIARVFYFWKKWKMEAYFLAGNLLVMGVVSTVFKYIINRSRPDLLYLIDKPMGPSFPSWHTASSMVVALTLVIIINQRMRHHMGKRCLQFLLVCIAILTAISRIYLGVHYPSDIVGGWLLAITIVIAVFPYYDKKRFELRFQNKQK